MALTPLDIQQHRFRRRLQGYDPREVEDFLEQAAAALENQQRENFHLAEEIHALQADIAQYQRREGTFKSVLLHSQKVLDQMKANAEKQAGLIVADAEGKAAKLLLQAQHRLVQLQEHIGQLKRQRVQIEVEIGAIIESHRRLLNLGQEQISANDGEDDKIKVLKQGL
ncbi:MAG: DivIVA domain-containing protein [Desulfobacterales bacterium]|jgi:cell division initiation protein|nr:DivIVA domain-containing protein [Desulfobacterales bacterium]